MRLLSRMTVVPIGVAVLMVVLFGLSPEVSPSALGAEAYRKNHRPLQCFMKVFTDLDAACFHPCRKAPTFVRLATDPIEIRVCQEAGKAFYEQARKKIDPLLANVDQIIAIPLPTCSRDQIENLRVTTRIPDFHFCRDLTWMLRAVALFFSQTGREREAMDLLRLCFRFGQIMAAGDGDAPGLLNITVGCSLQMMAIGDLPARILRSGTLPASYLEAISADFLRMETGEVPFDLPLKCEFTYHDNAVRYERFDVLLLSRDPFDAPLVGYLKRFPNIDRNRIRETWLRKMSAFHETVNAMLERNRGNPRGFRKEVTTYGEEISRKAKAGQNASPANSRDPYGISGDIMLSISWIDYAKLFDKWQERRLRVLGTTAMLRIAAAAKRGEGLPATVSDLKKVLGTDLPTDPYSDDKASCLFRNDNGTLVLYSLGSNGLDDHGNPEGALDTILFRY